MGVPDPDIITQHQDLLATHRRTLVHLLRQAAQYGGLNFAPPQTAHGIAQACAEIQRIKAELREWGVEVEDHPNDQAPPTANSPTVSRRNPWSALVILALLVITLVGGVILARALGLLPLPISISPTAIPTTLLEIVDPPHPSSVVTLAPSVQSTHPVPALPTPTARGGGSGRIAFVSNRDDISAIYLMEADSRQPRRLTRMNQPALRPAWSPDGRMLVFSVGQDDDFDIYRMGVNDTDAINLTLSPGVRDFGRSSWAPDGTHIAFTSWCDPDDLNNDEICQINSDGSKLIQLTDDPASDYDPAWSPDGTQIAFVSHRQGKGDADIYIMAADGSNPTPLITTDKMDLQPAWSPDGTQLAFSSGQDGEYDIYVLDIASGRVTQLTQNVGRDAGPSWSPDGTRIAFSSTRDDPDPDTCTDETCNFEIYVMDADGQDPIRLTESPAQDRAPTWQPIVR